MQSLFSDQQPSGVVFGIPLTKCIANDTELQRKRNSGPLKERKDSDVILHRQGNRKSSSSSQGSLENILSHNGTSFTESQKVGYLFLNVHLTFAYKMPALTRET